MEVAVINNKGAETGRKVSLSSAVFGLEAPNDHAIYEDVRNILAHRRQGTSKSKERGEIAGSKKKPYRQKGTGNARPGRRSSPIWRKGGRAFGPRPRTYGFKLNKKVRQLARRSALTYKAQDSRITVLENFSMDAPATKSLLKMLQDMDLASTKILLVVPEDNKNVHLSSRNLPKTQVIRASDLNTYDILNAEQLVFIEESIVKVEQQLG